MQAINDMQNLVLRQICRPAQYSNKVGLPVKTIVQRAQSCITNLLEDVICFLGQVTVLSYNKETHTVQIALFSQKEQTNDITAAVNLLKQEV